MKLNFFTIVTLLSVFITIVLTIFFFVTKKGHKTENKILACLLIIFNIQIIYSYCTSSFAFQYFMEWHKTIFLFRQTSFLIGPLIYFYINSFFKRKDIICLQSLYHFLPFAGILFITKILVGNLDQFIIWTSELDMYDTIAILLYNLVYIVLSVIILRSKNIRFRDFYRSIKDASHTTWIQLLLLGFIALWIVNLNSFAIYMIARRPGWCAYTQSIFALLAFIFGNALMFILLLRPDVHYVTTKYKNNKVLDDEKEEYLQRLSSCMETVKPFLNPEISLEYLANEISVNPRILSQLINETYNKNFKCYILEFRIKESMQLLRDTKYCKHNVQEILYKVGFNSKSSFNDQFKKYTNLTPQEYRAKYFS